MGEKRKDGDYIWGEAKKQKDFIAEKVPFFERWGTLLNPFSGEDEPQKRKKLMDRANEIDRQQKRDAEIEAIRKKRMQTPGTGGG